MTRRFCVRPYDDRGTSLVLALVFITVVSLVVMTVLAFADTSMRSTIALRNQVSETAAAEGAAQAAINAVRKSPYNGNSAGCFGATSTMPLSNFYQRPDGSQDSVRVTCELDPNLGSAPVAVPQQGLLTFDSASGILVPGLTVTGLAGVGLRVAGPVHSNSSISVTGGSLTASGPITARGACSKLLGGVINPVPTCPNGNLVTVAEPNLTPLVSGLTPRAVPSCASTSGVYNLDPGKYTDALGLSALTSPGCKGGKAIVHLLPGIYHFDFDLFKPSFPPSIGVWAVTAGTVVAGNTSLGVTLTPGVEPTLPGACRSPVPTGAGWVAPNPDDGVTMVFGGTGQLNVTGGGRAEICGRYTPTGNPFAILAQPTTGTLGLWCTTAGFPCAALSTGLVLGAAPKAFYVQGTTMLPTREFVVSLDDTSQQLYRGGVIARRAGAFSWRSVSAPPVIEAPPSNPTGIRRTVVYLNAFVCPGASTCDSGGELTLRAKVAFTDPTGVTVAGARQVSVLSWSLQS